MLSTFPMPTVPNIINEGAQLAAYKTHVFTLHALQQCSAEPHDFSIDGQHEKSYLCFAVLASFFFVGSLEGPRFSHVYAQVAARPGLCP